jgi:hypothetical protein
VFDAGKSSAGLETCKTKFTVLRDQGAHHSPPILSTNSQRGILMSAPSHLQNVGQHRPLVTPRSRSRSIFAG